MYKMVSAKWTILFFACIVALFNGFTRAHLIIEKEKAETITEKSDSEVNKASGTDFCTEVCGDHYGVICKGDRSNRRNIICTCLHEVEDFDVTDKECKINYCKLKCGNATCVGNRFREDEYKCVCRERFQDFDQKKRQCRVNYCKKVCGADESVICNGDEFEIKESKDCKCENDAYTFYDGKCRKMCTDYNDCKNEGICRNDLKICICKYGTTGDMCEVITDCQKWKFRYCRDGKGECVLKDGEAQCQCPEGKMFYEKLGHCEEHCNSDSDCKGYNRKCNNENFCVCPDGYEGEDCDVVTGCKFLRSICRKIETECIFDKDAPEKATCKCKVGYTFDRDTYQCKHSYCYPSNPCKDGDCRYNEKLSIQYCQCRYDEYYNYRTEKCEDLPDACLLNRIPCSEHEKCVFGRCECKYEKKEKEECKPNLCRPNPCFGNANCSEDTGMCQCKDGMYFNGKRCENAGCNLQEFHKECRCPSLTKRTKKDDECLPIRFQDTCSKYCYYGVCVRTNNKDTCMCYSFATLDENGVCMLNKKLCPSGQLNRYREICKCEGQYTQADDNITCRFKTCEDEDVKKECASKGAACKMDWKGRGYYCECRKGHYLNEQRKCTDPCGIKKNIEECAKNDLFCYISPSNVSKMGMTCGCPPTFRIENDKCTRQAKYVYLISNITVFKKRYEMQNDTNKVLLNAELIQSMESTFSFELFDYGYLYDYRTEGDILNCSIWINFKKDPKTELERMPMVTKTFSGGALWPPYVLLSGDGFKQVTYRQLSFCSREVKDLLCGKYASCLYNSCYCKNGFKIIENSIREMAGYKIQRCEDIDECSMGTSICSKNTTCVNTIGDYKCVCKEGFKKSKSSYDPETDKNNCSDMCTPSPCNRGYCSLNRNTFSCHCPQGYAGSFCEKKDVYHHQAKKITIIWMVVGSLLVITLMVLTIVFLRNIKKMKKRNEETDSGVRVPSPQVNDTEVTDKEKCDKVIHPSLYPQIELNECQEPVAPSIDD